MTAGPELDALVAEKVMGLVRGKDFGEWAAHEWKRDEAGEMDIFAYDGGDIHNGPACVLCGYGYCHHCQDGPDQPCRRDPPGYSTDIAAAWEVVAKLHAALPTSGLAYLDVRVGYRAGNYGTEYPTLNFAPYWFAEIETGEREWSSDHADSAPHAICLAALRAVGVEVS